MHTKIIAYPIDSAIWINTKFLKGSTWVQNYHLTNTSQFNQAVFNICVHLFNQIFDKIKYKLIIGWKFVMALLHVYNVTISIQNKQMSITIDENIYTIGRSNSRIPLGDPKRENIFQIPPMRILSTC